MAWSQRTPSADHLRTVPGLASLPGCRVMHCSTTLGMHHTYPRILAAVVSPHKHVDAQAGEIDLYTGLCPHDLHCSVHSHGPLPWLQYVYVSCLALPSIGPTP